MKNKRWSIDQWINGQHSYQWTALFSTDNGLFAQLRQFLYKCLDEGQIKNDVKKLMNVVFSLIVVVSSLERRQAALQLLQNTQV
jgi:hypothetical protein